MTDLLIRSRKRNISIVFITQSFFKLPKDVRLNSTHFFILKIPNERELQQIALNLSSDIDFKNFSKIYKNCTAKPYYFLVNDTTLPSDNPLRFRKNVPQQLMILIERMKKYQPYHQARLISINILMVKKIIKTTS